MSIRRFIPIIRTIYSKEIKLAESKIDAANLAYINGDKQSALNLLRDAVEIDGTCIAARSKMAQIHIEIEDEKKNQSTSSSSYKPK